MMDAGLDAKNFIHLPAWAKTVCLVMLALGIVASLAIILLFFGSTDSRDWVLIGISGTQFLITTFVVAVVLFWSQTDANIDILKDRGERFLTDTMVGALGGITLAADDGGARTAVTVAPPAKDRRDLFGYPYQIDHGGVPVLRLWVGVNVHRLIVIYRFVDPVAGRDPAAFVAELERVFRFSLGAIESIGYGKPHFETLPLAGHRVAIWLTAQADASLLTDPAAKLFWAQDVAMMTESMIRAMRRNPDAVRADLETWPGPQ